MPADNRIDPISDAVKTLRTKRSALISELERVEAGLKALGPLVDGTGETISDDIVGGTSVDMAVKILSEWGTWKRMRQIYDAAKERGLKANIRSFSSSLYREAAKDSEARIVRHPKESGVFGLPDWEVK
ncbi:MAG: hypothetical protein O7H41_15895 [Planctomycetota bacterium]|nr:hypothetical protein [Planctomycetota bacterium]